MDAVTVDLLWLSSWGPCPSTTRENRKNPSTIYQALPVSVDFGVAFALMSASDSFEKGVGPFLQILWP